jgi:hypothetical protein
MKKHILTLTTCGLILVLGIGGAKAEESIGHRGQGIDLTDILDQSDRDYWMGGC